MTVSFPEGFFEVLVRCGHNKGGLKKYLLSSLSSMLNQPYEVWAVALMLPDTCITAQWVCVFITSCRLQVEVSALGRSRGYLTASLKPVMVHYPCKSVQRSFLGWFCTHLSLCLLQTHPICAIRLSEFEQVFVNVKSEYFRFKQLLVMSLSVHLSSLLGRAAANFG